MLRNSVVVPKWLSTLLTEKFFNACIIHEDAKKNEKNAFCLDCCEGICPCCLIDHRSHCLLQIRRYVYNDVLLLTDAEKLIDCAQIQSYTTNSAKVVFLKERPLSGPPRVSDNLCFTCNRNLHESSLFCSISCKLQHLIKTGYKFSKYLRTCEVLALPESGSEDGTITPNSVLKPTGSVKTESGSSTVALAELIACTATTEIVKKKRSSLSVPRSVFRPVRKPVAKISGALMNRRKGTPQRSPLY